jgi:hypothetical protein
MENLIGTHQHKRINLINMRFKTTQVNYNLLSQLIQYNTKSHNKNCNNNKNLQPNKIQIDHQKS